MIFLRNKGGKISILIALMIYRLFLDYSYFEVVVKTYGYYGFRNNSTFEQYLFSIALFLLFSSILIKQAKAEELNFSSVVLFLTNIVITIPFTTLVSAGMVSMGITLLFTIYWLSLYVFQKIIKKQQAKRFKITINNSVLGDKVAQVFGIISLFVVLYISFRYTHFRLIFNIFDVYTYREEASTYNLPLVLSYAFSWTRALNILFLSYSVVKRKRLLSIVYFASQMLSFGIDGLKSTLFMPFLAVFLCLAFKNINFIKTKITLIWGMAGITVIGAIESLLLKSSLIINVIIRRVLFIPAYLNVCYGDFFLKNTPDYFRASFLRFIGATSPYENIGTIIGGKYFGKVAMNCNNGMFADAITNLGIAGVVLMPFILVLLLRFVDNCAANVNQKIFITTAIYFSIVLSNSFVTTTFITHGLLVSCVVLFFFGSSNDNAITPFLT